MFKISLTKTAAPNPTTEHVNVPIEKGNVEKMNPTGTAETPMPKESIKPEKGADANITQGNKGDAVFPTVGAGGARVTAGKNEFVTPGEKGDAVAAGTVTYPKIKNGLEDAGVKAPITPGEQEKLVSTSGETPLPNAEVEPKVDKSAPAGHITPGKEGDIVPNPKPMLADVQTEQVKNPGANITPGEKAEGFHKQFSITLTTTDAQNQSEYITASIEDAAIILEGVARRAGRFMDNSRISRALKAVASLRTAFTAKGATGLIGVEDEENVGEPKDLTGASELEAAGMHETYGPAKLRTADAIGILVSMIKEGTDLSALKSALAKEGITPEELMNKLSGEGVELTPSEKELFNA